VLDARQYKTTGFAQEVLRLLATLRVSTWGTSGVTAGAVAVAAGAMTIRKVSGSLTNAVFFVSHPGATTLLLRIYGPSSSSLISRPHELHTLHVLSSRYGIGPRVYGTFVNGRVEEHFESEALTPGAMRDPQVSMWIGMRMGELHRVDLCAVVHAPEGKTEGVCRNVRSWLVPARDVVRLARARGHPGVDELALERFVEEWEVYWAWLVRWERTHGRSERVFAHNDTQYGNLLRLRDLRPGEAAHHRIIVVDFEYASVNAAAFDIANHFHEWMADYDSARPHELHPERYPGPAARRNFYRAYLSQARPVRVPGDADLDALDAAVEAWSPASHAMWAVWGIVQAREDVVQPCAPRGEFDYLAYARARIALFRACCCK